MADPGTMDFDDTDNKTVYFAYDHPVWEKYEATTRGVNTFLVNTTALSSKPDIYELNRQKSYAFLPVFIVLCFILVFGVLSNILVCHIYRCRSRRATSYFFVIFFAIFDMTGTLIGIPLEISILALPYLYDVVPMCKIMGFVETWSVCAQCLTLICVAYDCYRKCLCQPGKEFNVKKARLFCAISVVISVLVSIPSLVVFGTKKVKIPQQSLFGVTCTVDQTMPHWLRILYNVCVLGTFTVSLCVMTVLYGLIGVSWCKQRQAEERGEKPSPAKREFPKKHRFVREDATNSSMTNNSEEICRLHYSKASASHSSISRSDPSRFPLKSSSGIVKSNSLQASSIPPTVAIKQLNVKNTRQASIFTVISIVFVVTMLPFVVVMILCATTPVFNHFSSSTTEIVFNLCIRSYLFNYLVKPVAYFILNTNFRREVKYIFNTLWSLCPFSVAPSQQTPQQLRWSSSMGSARSTSRTPIYRPPRASS